MTSRATSEILFHDVNQEEVSKVSPDLPIFRYIRLPTLLMMLRGEAFIPTLTKLQETDPRECRFYGSGKALICSSLRWSKIPPENG
jgi:hypothetical protein